MLNLLNVYFYFGIMNSLSAMFWLQLDITNIKMHKEYRL